MFGDLNDRWQDKRTFRLARCWLAVSKSLIAEITLNRLLAAPGERRKRPDWRWVRLLETMVDNTELCKALFEAFARGDEERVRALCASDMQARQNNNPPMDLDTLLEFSRAVLRTVKDFRYENARRSSTATGFVEEHSVRGTLPDGTDVELAVCVVADVRNGKVCDLREYLDLSAASGLIEALA
jgi:ketosteroid isomerase-like protein